MANGTSTSKQPPATSRKTPYERLKHDLENDPRVSQEVALGKRVGFYKMKGHLGTGNFSRVKLGNHLLTNEKVAVKVIDKTKLDENARRLLSREITCMEHLDHPNVIRLFEVIETFQRLHIVMECAMEGDLHVKVVKNGPFNEDEGRTVYLQIVAAIKHMHKKSVVHRDLKAENVFFVSENQVKVGDFGFSTQHNGTALDTFCGSPPYAAPELFGEEDYSGPPVDIWALGVLLYFVLTGNMPFRGSTVPQLKETILEGEYHMPKSLTPACQDLISGILVKDTEKRYSLIDICSSVWLRGGSDCPTSSSDSGVGSSKSTLDASFNAGDTINSDILRTLEKMGVPTSDSENLLGEPRNPIAGTYRILLHRKHTTTLNAAAVGAHGENGCALHEGGGGGCLEGEMVASKQTERRQTKSSSQKSKLCIIL